MTIRIGVILPPTNVTCEAEFGRFVPEGVALHYNRVSRPDTKITAESLLAMEATIERAAGDLAALRPAVMLYCCTAATFMAGGGNDRSASDKIKAATGLTGITTSSAVVSALHALGLKRVFMISPYPDDILDGAIRFLAHYGVTVKHSYSFKHKDSLENWRRAPQDIANVLEAHLHLLSDVDGVFLGCTNLRSMELIGAMERRAGLPVVSSNSATLWRGLKAAGLRTDRIDLGRLYSADPP